MAGDAIRGSALMLERKCYANLSHSMSKAINLNSWKIAVKASLLCITLSC